MKKYFYSLILILLVCSCSDILDVKPETGQTITNSFKTEKDFSDLLNSMNAVVQRAITSSSHLTMGFFTDAIASQNFIDQRNLDYFSLSLNSWETQYDGILLSNMMIDNIHRATDMKQDRKDFYMGQAYFLKGLFYFEIARSFGDAPIPASSTDYTPHARKPAPEVLDEAIADALKAYELLPVYSDLVDMNKIRITIKQYGCKGSAAALLAHLYAWKASMSSLYNWPDVDATMCYTQAADWASKIISGETGTYVLEASVEDYVKNENIGMFTRELAVESIFELQGYNPTGANGAMRMPAERMGVLTYPIRKDMGFNTPTAIDGGRVGMKLFKTTVDEMYANADERKAAYFYNDESSPRGGYAYPYKWREILNFTNASGNLASVGSINANLTYWRLSGIYLLRAECYNMIGNTSSAEADLNVVRARANADAYPSSQDTDLQLAIFKEREKELLWEGHRYYDVIRNHYFRTELSDVFKNLSDQDVQNGALYLPIGDNAFVNNSLMLQTTYWSKYFHL